MRLRRGGLGSAGQSGSARAPGRSSANKKTAEKVYTVSGRRNARIGQPSALARTAREIRSPQVSTLHRKPGARWFTRGQQTDTQCVRAVNDCGQRSALLRCPQLLAGGRPVCTGCTPVRVLSFRPRRPSPLHRPYRQTRVLSSRSLRARRCRVLADFLRSSARALGRARTAFSPCSLVCRSASRRVRGADDKMFGSGSKTRPKTIGYLKSIVI